MTKIHILTIFPDFFDVFNYSILGKALDAKLISLDIIDIRKYTTDKYKKVDDTPFGGGAGMLMQYQPIKNALDDIDPAHKLKRIIFSPKGDVLSQHYIESFNLNEFILICVNYEGIDERLIDTEIDEMISIGDYILTGGEVAAFVFVNALGRYIDGVLGSGDSLKNESFANGLLEYPQYTKPKIVNGQSVPDILLTGNHKLIDKWRIEKSLEETFKHRIDLLNKINIEDYIPKK